MKRIVVVSKEWGIYLGHALGLGFWTRLDCAGQTSAVTFNTKEEAIEHIKGWDENNNPGRYRFVVVECAAFGYVTIAELLRSGVPREYIEPMTAELEVEGRS